LFPLLAKRAHFYNESARLFLLAEKKVVSLSVSSLSMVNTHYVLSKHLSEKQARAVLRDLKLLIKVLPLNGKIIDVAMNSDIADFEDAIQYHSALEYRQEVIITRNLKDFKTSTLPVMTAGQFIHSLQFEVKD
jgi:hypothetical protein